MIIYHRVFKLWSRHEIASEAIKGKTQQVWKRKLSFLYKTHLHDLFYITVKYHNYNPKGIQVTKRTRIRIKKHKRGDNSKSNKARALIFVSDTVLQNCEVSSKYSKRYSSYWADTKMSTDRRTDGQTTGGPQAHHYIPRINQSGDKNCALEEKQIWNLSKLCVLSFKVNGYVQGK